MVDQNATMHNEDVIIKKEAIHQSVGKVGKKQLILGVWHESKSFFTDYFFIIILSKNLVDYIDDPFVSLYIVNK